MWAWLLVGLATAPAFSNVGIYIDDVPFEYATATGYASRPGVTVNLISATGTDQAHMRFMRRTTVVDLAEALDWIAAHWTPEDDA